MSRKSDIVKVKGLEKKFGYKTVLRKIDLLLQEGDFLSLFGPNGAGKTTLLNILCSLMLPSSGEVSIAGFDPRSDREALSRVVGVVSHQTFLYPNLSAFENLRFYGRMYGVAGLNEKIEEQMAQVGLSDYQDDWVQTFSRGMQQRLSLARATIHNPLILFLDEPYTGLDQTGAEALKQMLCQFQNQGKTIIMTSHNLKRGLELCSRAAILNSGRVVYHEKISGTTEDVFRKIYMSHTKKRSIQSQVSL